MNILKANKILIIRLSSLGDILLTTPVLRAVRKQNPNAKIDFVVRKEYHDALKYNPYINNLYLYENADAEALTENLGKYDVIIDLQNNLRSKKLLKNKSENVYKFHKRSFHKFLLVNFKINLLKDAPPIPYRYTENIKELILDNESLDLFLPDNLSSRIEHNIKNIGFAPGSRHFTKMYPKEYFIELGKKLSAEGFNIVLFGGKSDKEICKKISLDIPYSIDLSNDNDLFQIAFDMKKCDVVICNDSGLMHTAVAAGIPVITIFGSTVKEFGFTPYKNKSLILENNSLTCRPCSHIGKSNCPKGHFKCMNEITPDFVFNEILQFLRDKR